MTGDERKDHNNDVLNKFFQGDSLTSFNKMASWFPPRPIIEKDKGALDLIFRRNQDDKCSKGQGEGRVRMVCDCD